MNLPKTDLLDAAECPLCRQPNECQLCTPSAYKGPCWCATVKIPGELIARVSPEALNKACICQECVARFHRGEQPSLPPRTNHERLF